MQSASRVHSTQTRQSRKKAADFGDHSYHSSLITIVFIYSNIISYSSDLRRQRNPTRFHTPFLALNPNWRCRILDLLVRISVWKLLEQLGCSFGFSVFWCCRLKNGSVFASRDSPCDDLRDRSASRRGRRWRWGILPQGVDMITVLFCDSLRSHCILVNYQNSV